MLCLWIINPCTENLRDGSEVVFLLGILTNLS